MGIVTMSPNLESMLVTDVGDKTNMLVIFFDMLVKFQSVTNITIHGMMLMTDM